ncbi:DUF7210 family protein [Parathalassolituus penaei]|uniref:DUF7210 domain-containing protein n=1 Tax=Parathalassolituus penaei TaxID=2997323 RepID=A0A9X3EF64_9GAMM|nr:hypothetical protein [Parathalassolituus penaei]MCY0966131.1 hypothetical protein [Parathalassolituus penaei]
MASASKTPATATETVVLAKPHTHQGKAFKPGEKLTVTVATANWLRSEGVVEAVAAMPATAQ